MERTSFLFYADWYDIIRDEPDAQRLKVFDAIVRYAFDEEEPTDPEIKMAFKLIKSQLDRDKQKYHNICKKRTEAINKRWEDYKRNQENTSNTNEYTCIQMNTNDTNRTHNDNDNDNEIYIKNTSIEVQESAASKDATLEKVKAKFYNELIPYVEKYGKEMIREFYDYWTEPNKSRTKIRMQLERTWDTSRRLSTWANKPFRYRNNDNTTNRNNSSGASATEVANLVMQALNETN